MIWRLMRISKHIGVDHQHKTVDYGTFFSLTTHLATESRLSICSRTSKINIRIRSEVCHVCCIYPVE
jgi:hypothetical protein